MLTITAIIDVVLYLGIRTKEDGTKQPSPNTEEKEKKTLEWKPRKRRRKGLNKKEPSLRKKNEREESERGTT